MSLHNSSSFFGVLPTDGLFASMTQAQVDGVNAILAAMDGDPLSWAAYALATAYHETGRAMVPVVEANWLSEEWRRVHLAKYYPWYGRGFVQLTWKKNYLWADAKLSLNGELIRSPERALELPIAASIMRKGMDEGWFAAKKFADYLPQNGAAQKPSFVAARKIINGTDKADLIAGYAMSFQEALVEGRWS